MSEGSPLAARVARFIAIIDQERAERSPDLRQPGKWSFHGWVGSRVWVSRAEREGIEAHYRALGYEVRREKRMSSGARYRGLWLRKEDV